MEYLLGVVRHARTCPMFSKITKSQDLPKGLSYFVYLLHAVTHPWKLQFCHEVLVGYGLACSKFSKGTFCQYLWKGLSGFVDFLHLVIYMLDIYWSYKICYLGLALSGMASSPIRWSDILNLKNLKAIWGIKLIFYM